MRELLALEEPPSYHWDGCKEEKTIHSGITKNRDGNKTYHPYISDDLTHDQAFVRAVMEEMLGEMDIEHGSTLIVFSDNCSCQYKSSQNFHDLQAVSTKYNIKVIRIYGIPGHGKNEIDMAGGIVKIALRRSVSMGGSFLRHNHVQST